MKKTNASVGLLLITLLLTACGQKGPLTLPAPKQAASAPASP
ncbi:lipoprotein [Paucibacter sp. O1-1]|nr:lipoprotein [Paucibacter sp. M5-1]MCU7373567.1 lipoprotein [Paucibacter sp. O1-1]MCZ7879860.1 lipoprotein [Paucibacter sp. M5-1]MDA3828568.1 lipoprotein [Paucibacter sp. O1-1]